MNKSLTSRTSLPASFDAAKYDACATFKTADWYSNLMQRALSRSMAETADWYLSELREKAESLFDIPILPADKLEEGGGGFEKLVRRSQVTDETALEHILGGVTLEGSEDHPRGREYRKASEVFLRDDWDHHAYDVLAVPAWKMMTDIGLNLMGQVSVKVDLFSSEEKLVDDFRKWLRVTRAALDIPNLQRRFKGGDFDRWYQNRILAYLDLSFWAQINGIQLTNQVIGVALFPDEFNVNLAERVRKVVAPLALSAASPPYLEALFSQALEEEEQK
ncbi:DUF6387 family protein [Burkholderia gladioli]|uniref:DUF6387 family protein n=1 Tax=Burkholderia gladioli TaxID=28095 RepID=UPI0016415F3A|nr:DUF6387 family protein [Burkholderia gladioli]MDN7724977.1 DUF6387 family protein [Burkholderia gladioli]